MPTRIAKKKPEEIRQDPLRELEMSMEDWHEFEHGVTLFNAGKFWHAHEAWELIWQRHAEDERLFFQGLIQLAAAYHQMAGKGSSRGMINNFEKAAAKLKVFRPQYLGIHIDPILEAIEDGRQLLERNGEVLPEKLGRSHFPKLQFHKPSDPDLLVEIRSIPSDERFIEGARLFNTGYHWEAHEIWEEVWREQEGEGKTLMQAFVQMAAAYSFIKQKKADSARYLLGKSAETFQQFEHFQFGLPLREIAAAVQGCLSAIYAGNGNTVIKNLPVPSIEVQRK